VSNEKLLFLVYRVVYLTGSVIFLLLSLRRFWKGLGDLRVKYGRFGNVLQGTLKDQSKEIFRFFLIRMIKRGWPLILLISVEFLIWLFLTLGIFKPLN